MRLKGWVFKSERVNESITTTTLFRDKTGSSYYWYLALSNAATLAVRRPGTAYRVFDTMPVNIHQVHLLRSHLGFRPSVSLGFASPSSAPRPRVGLTSLSFVEQSHGYLNWIRLSGVAPLAFMCEHCNVTKARQSSTITAVTTTTTTQHNWIVSVHHSLYEVVTPGLQKKLKSIKMMWQRGSVDVVYNVTEI